MNFSGAWTALITPFKEDCSVDWDGLKKNVLFQIKEGISGLLPMGTTGESPTLNHDEHNEVNKRVFEFAGNKCGILAGCGSNSTEESIKSVAAAKEAGMKAALVIDCYYNGPSSLELRTRHYEVIAKKFPGIDFIPYIIPGRTGCEMSAYDLAILAENCPNVHAVKEATGNIERMELEGGILPDGFAILSGDDGITFKIMSSPKIKGKGVISVMTNVTPGAIGEMCKLLLDGKIREAAGIDEKLKPLFDAITVKAEREVKMKGRVYTVVDKFRNPLPVKTMMNGLGIPSGPCRMPLGKMTFAGVSVVRDALKTVWRKNPEVLEPLADFYGVDIEKRLNDDSVWKELATGIKFSADK
ncbi:MAG: 4-hydroxy-tetrahydrodipicolinate synthase [bacterium]